MTCLVCQSVQQAIVPFSFTIPGVSDRFGRQKKGYSPSRNLRHNYHGLGAKDPVFGNED